MGRRLVGALLVAALVATGACRGSDDNKSAITSATTSSTTATTVDLEGGATVVSTTTTVASRATSATTAATGATTTTQAQTQVKGKTVDDAPRDPYVDRSDNTGSFVYASSAPKPPAQSGRSDDDALTFSITCSVASDGHGNCHMELTNNVRRAAQFPGGLTVTVTLQREGGTATQTTMPSHITSLRPGETAIVDGTIDVFEPGGYTYFATTTVHWP